MYITVDKKLCKNANDFLKQEIQKRWSLVHKNKKHGNWVCRFPDGTLSSFRLYVYSSSSSFSEPCILCLTDALNLLTSKHGKFFALSSPGTFELSFDAEEAEYVIPWALDNYFKVKTYPEWLSPRFQCNGAIGNRPSYLWTDTGYTKYHNWTWRRYELIKRLREEKILNNENHV